MACINQASSVPTILTTSFIIVHGVVFLHSGQACKSRLFNGKSERKSGNKYEINAQAYKSISYSSHMICQTAGTFKYILRTRGTAAVR